jgi:hypothetical protein
MMHKAVWRTVVEMGFIVFLFYANLLMSEFTRSGKAQERGLVWALSDVFTPANFLIAVIAALIAHVLFESLRSKF